MNILARIEKLYHGSGRTFLHGDLIEHLHSGYVFITPQAALMGFRCKASDVRDAIKGGWGVKPHQADEDGDCWMVWLAVGTVRDVLTMTPFPLPFVAFARRDRLRLWRFAEITKRIAGAPQSD